MPDPPTGVVTPPGGSGAKRSHAADLVRRYHERPNADAVDADALNKVLLEFEEASRSRDLTPNGSPSRKRQRIYG